MCESGIQSVSKPSRSISRGRSGSPMLGWTIAPNLMAGLLSSAAHAPQVGVELAERAECLGHLLLGIARRVEREHQLVRAGAAHGAQAVGDLLRSSPYEQRVDQRI